MTTVTGGITRPIVDAVKRLFELRRKRGTARALYALSWKLTSLPLNRRCLRFAAVDLLHISLAEQKEMPPTRRTFVVRAAIVDDLPALSEYFGTPQLVKERFERGDLCVMTVCKDQIGAAVWIAVGPGEYREDWNDLRCVFRFPGGVGWTFDGKGTKLGAWGTLMAHLPRILHEFGTSELFTLIDCNNWQSLDAHRSLGYANVGVLLSSRVLGLAATACRPHDRWWRRLPLRIGSLELRRKPTPTGK